MRLLIYVLIFFIIYQIYKAARVSLSGPPPRDTRQDSDVITAELVEDPVCHAYCPKDDSLRAERGGRTYYFCSEECRKKFVSGS